jgi:Fatty acid hydroxylase superfamily
LRRRTRSVRTIALPYWPLANGWASFVAAFLLFDLLRYLVHRCKHAVPFLWRLHALHHSDPDVDVTTAARLHPIESLLGSGVFWLAVILLGIPATVGLSYELAVFAIEAVQHGNIRLPERLQRWLQPVPPRCSSPPGGSFAPRPPIEPHALRWHLRLSRRSINLFKGFGIRSRALGHGADPVKEMSARFRDCDNQRPAAAEFAFAIAFRMQADAA